MLKVKLLRDVTYDCGPVQRAIIRFLREHGNVVNCRYRSDLLGKVNVNVSKDSLRDSLRRLEKRGILSVDVV